MGQKKIVDMNKFDNNQLLILLFFDYLFSLSLSLKINHKTFFTSCNNNKNYKNVAVK